jgi:hypothetical protein
MNELNAQFGLLNGSIIKTSINLVALAAGRKHPYETVVYTPLIKDGYIMDVYETVEQATEGHYSWWHLLHKK